MPAFAKTEKGWKTICVRFCTTLDNLCSTFKLQVSVNVFGSYQLSWDKFIEYFSKLKQNKLKNWNKKLSLKSAEMQQQSSTTHLKIMAMWLFVWHVQHLHNYRRNGWIEATKQHNECSARQFVFNIWMGKK